MTVLSEKIVKYPVTLSLNSEPPSRREIQRKTLEEENFVVVAVINC